MPSAKPSASGAISWRRGLEDGMVEGFSIQRRLGDRPMWVLVGDLDIETVGPAFGVLTTEIDGADGDVRLHVGRLAFIGDAGLDMLVELAHGLVPRAAGSC
jgi:hypothetical protein